MLDATFVFLLLVVGTVFEHYWFWPRFRAQIADGVPGARLHGYNRGIIAQWAFVAMVAALWIYYARSPEALRLAAPSGWRLGVSALLVIVMLALVLYQYLSVVKITPERRIAVKSRFSSVAFLLPHSRREYLTFLLLSLTAGFCEELIYRGYLVWFLATWLGTTGAFVAVVVLFGIGHTYQGRKGAIRATLAGAVMTGIVALTGWLVPAMIIHALVDAGSGTAGYLLLRDEASERTMAPLESAQPVAG